MARHDEYGRELPDPTPVSVPANWQRPLPLQEQIRRFVRVELSQQADAVGDESFEEADDFDTGEDEPEWLSPYEVRDAPQERLFGDDPDPPTDPGIKAPGEASRPGGAPPEESAKAG